MEDLVDRLLRDQEQSLRAVMAAFARVRPWMDSLEGDVGWRGPASAAYDAAVRMLRIELYAVEIQLGAALRDTVDAISPESLGGGDSRGG